MEYANHQKYERSKSQGAAAIGAYIPLKHLNRNIQVGNIYSSELANFTSHTGPTLYLPQLETVDDKLKGEWQLNVVFSGANEEAKTANLQEVIIVVLIMAQEQIRKRTSLYDVALVPQC